MNAPLLRQRILDGLSGRELAEARRLLALHLVQDGSATRLCEAVVGGPVRLVLHDQHITDDLPETVRAVLPGTHCIERCISLVDPRDGRVMMDNLSWIALATVPEDVRADLIAGQLPIGHLLERLWIRRRTLPVDPALAERLWQQVGQPDPAALRSYVIHTPPGPVMVIGECFRRGMLGGRD